MEVYKTEDEWCKECKSYGSCREISATGINCYNFDPIEKGAEEHDIKNLKKLLMVE